MKNALAIGLAGILLTPLAGLAHGDVTPQAVDTSALPALGEEWLDENPWRSPEDENFRTALEIGASGYNSNCARCHGLGVVSGGTAPDLRYLSADDLGDEWFLERFKTGYTQNGITKMPAFGELLGQEAAWAIRTYIETRPDDGAIDAHIDRLTAIRDELAGGSGDVEAIIAELTEINSQIETGSGADFAVSVAQTAAWELEKNPEHLAQAAELLTIGLPSTH